MSTAKLQGHQPITQHPTRAESSALKLVLQVQFAELKIFHPLILFVHKIIPQIKCTQANTAGSVC
jgi:hypothetical protein